MTDLVQCVVLEHLRVQSANCMGVSHLSLRRDNGRSL